MCIFFGRKIKTRFSAPKTKTQFGRPLIRTSSMSYTQQLNTVVLVTFYLQLTILTCTPFKLLTTAEQQSLCQLHPFKIHDRSVIKQHGGMT